MCVLTRYYYRGKIHSVSTFDDVKQAPRASLRVDCATWQRCKSARRRKCTSYTAYGYVWPFFLVCCPRTSRRQCTACVITRWFWKRLISFAHSHVLPPEMKPSVLLTCCFPLVRMTCGWMGEAVRITGTWRSRRTSCPTQTDRPKSRW